MEEFVKRLIELRTNSNLSQEALAKATGLSRSAISLWELGIRIPSAQAVVTLAKYFGVSTDYLLGVEL